MARHFRPEISLLGVVIGVMLAHPPVHAGEPSTGIDRALRAVAGMRQRIGPAAPPTEDTWQEMTYRGRESLEIKGRTAAAEGRHQVQDYAIFDLGTGRLAAYIIFPNSSRRKAGEPILPMSEISSKADASLRLVVPERTLALESIQRYRMSGQESIYYEVRYAPQEGDIRFLHPPVRLLLDASTGNLFRFDVDPDWIDPLPVPRARISRSSAERIATVSLRTRNLGEAFGPGAVLGKVAGDDLYYVRPNAWLGFSTDDPAERARAAWVVGFFIEGAPEPGPQSLFIDAASGRVLGGQPGPPP